MFSALKRKSWTRTFKFDSDDLLYVVLLLSKESITSCSRGPHIGSVFVFIIGQ